MKKFLQVIIFFTLALIVGVIQVQQISNSADSISEINTIKPMITPPPAVETNTAQTSQATTSPNTENTIVNKTGYYQVFKDGEYLDGFSKYEDAIDLALQHKKTHISSQYGSKRIWDNYPPFIVYTSNTDHQAFYEFGEAVAYAKKFDRSFMYHSKDDSMIWNNVDPLPESKIISGITRIKQNPELPRGCEVTSLAMLLNYKGFNVSKLELAERVDKNPTSISRSGGKIYCGDPNDGFIGDMYNMSNFGFGVYHKPIAKLLAEFIPYSAVDLSGCEFEDLYYFLSLNRPVWVIINARYRVLPDGEFQTWITPNGESIKITYREHSALVTGYDNENIYFLDPLNEITSLNKAVFIALWEQMGRQAVSVSN